MVPRGRTFLEAHMAYVLALYAGEQAHKLELVSVTTDPDLTRDFARRMLTRKPDPDLDPARAAVEAGRREALRMVLDEEGT
jgi:hypothetical protein